MTMRQRSTWSKPGEKPRQAAQARSAATSRTADIYEMNQEHPQPSAIEYENGDPDSWAETPVPGDKMTVKDEYEGDHVKRNEIGFGEFRDDTWKHKDSDQWNGKGKYDNAKVSAERKAQAAERVARALLRTANDSLVEEMTLDLMAMPSPMLAATLKRMDATLPESMPEQARFKRSLACAKLAARTLGDAATENSVTALGQIFAGLDDPTLKSILKAVASATVAHARVAQQEQEEDQGGKTSQVQQTSQVQPVAQEQDDEEEGGHTSQEEQDEEQTAQQQTVTEEQTVTQQEDQGHGLCPEDAAMLDEMLHQEMAPAPADELQQLFQPAPAPAPMGVPAAPPMMASSPLASQLPDISFDEDEAMAEPATAAAVTASGLDDLFSDHPEVQAQREIQAAQREQTMREMGYGPTPRTASAKPVGAKKLGAVRSTGPVSVEQTLENLWERPR